jgi:serine protease Do
MAGHLNSLIRQISPSFIAAVVGAAVALPLLTIPAAARGPDGIADVAEQVIEAVVNISTSQKVEQRSGPTPQLPPGSPFEEFFEEFFKNRRGQGDPKGER